MEVNKLFENDRKVVRETSAIINYFRLYELILATFSCSWDEGYEVMRDYFVFIGGKNTLRKLVIDINEESIDIFSNDFNDLLLKLEQNIETMQELTFSKDTISEELVELGNIYLDKSPSYEQFKGNARSAFSIIEDESCGLIEDVSEELKSIAKEYKKKGLI